MKGGEPKRAFRKMLFAGQSKLILGEALPFFVTRVVFGIGIASVAGGGTKPIGRLCFLGGCCSSGTLPILTLATPPKRALRWATSSAGVGSPVYRILKG